MEEERRNLEPGVGRSARRRKEASGPKETGGGSRRDDALTQERAPIYEALEAFQKMRVVPFDVPGHKRGRGNPELTKLLGETCMRLDVNSMKPLDNLCHPVSVIADAEQLAAEAFGAAHAFLMVGGTTSAVPEHGADGSQAGREDYIAAKCPPQRHGRHGAWRRGSGLCESGG